MSVWKSATYKLDSIRAAALYMDITSYRKDVFSFEIDDTENLLGIGKRFNLRNALVNGDISLDKLGIPIPEKIDDVLTNCFEHKAHVHVGMEAIAFLLQMFKRGVITPKKTINWDMIDTLTLELIKTVAPSTQVNINAFVNSMTAFARSPSHTKWREMGEAIKSLKTMSSKFDIGETLKNDFLQSDQFEIRLYKRAIAFVGLEHFHGTMCLLSMSELDRLILSSFSLASTLEYGALKGDDIYEVQAYKILDVLYDNRFGRVDWVVRAYHKAKDLLLFSYANDLKMVDFKELLDDINKEHLNDIMDIQGQIENWRRHDPAVAIELAQIYKFLPPPDFDPVSSLTEVKKWHDNPNQVRVDLEPLRKHMRANMIRTLHRHFSSWPGKVKNPSPGWRERYEDNTLEHFDDDWADEIDLHGVVPFIKKGDHALEKVEDKAMAVADEDAYRSISAFKDVPKSEKNMLLYALSKDELLNVDKENAFTVPRTVQAEYKPESHKPKGRVFFMSNGKARLLKSTVEDNIRTYLKSKAGVSMGQDPKKLEKYLTKTMAYTPAMLGLVAVIISLDMSKWSPKFPHEIKKMCYALWAEVFGEDDLKDYHLLTKGMHVHSVKADINLSYVTNAVDFEGDTGAMNTWFHSDLMSYALKVMKRKEVITEKAMFSCFIDDGALRVVVEQEKVKAVWDTFNEVYADHGFTTSLSKTNVSSIFGTYLGRIWYKGEEVTPGVKAFLKIMPDYSQKYRSFSDEVNQIFATVQGAIKAGTSWVIAYLKYIREFAFSFLRWSRWGKALPHRDYARWALWCVAPIGLGGFGMSSLQGLVSTLEESSFSMGVGILSVAGKAYPGKVEMINKILNQELRLLSKRAFIRNPKKIFRAGPTLDSTILERIIYDEFKKSHIRYGSWFKEMIDDAESFDIESYVEWITSHPDLNLVVIRELFKLTPIAAIDKFLGKFKKSASIQSILGYRLSNACHKASISNFKNVLEASARVA